MAKNLHHRKVSGEKIRRTNRSTKGTHVPVTGASLSQSPKQAFSFFNTQGRSQRILSQGNEGEREKRILQSGRPCSKHLHTHFENTDNIGEGCVAVPQQSGSHAHQTRKLQNEQKRAQVGAKVAPPILNTTHTMSTEHAGVGLGG